MMHSFDDRIREQFSDYSPEVPPHIWENIMAKKKKRRPFLWIWWLLPLLGAGVILITIRFGNDPSTDSKGQTEQSRSSITLTTDGEPNKVKRTDDTDLAVDQTAGYSVNSVNSKTAGIDKNDKKVPEKETQGTIENIASSPLAANYSSAGKKATGDKKGPISKPAKGKYSAADKGNYESLQMAQSGKKEKQNMSAGNDNSLRSEVSNKTMQEPFSALRNTNRNVAFKLFPPRNLKQEIPCPERNAAGNKKYFELYAGPDLVFRSFRDTGRSEYLQKRKESTSVAFAFSAGGRFTKVFNNGMSIRAGINYSHIREKFTLTEGNVVRTVFIIGNNGDTIGTYSTRGTLYRRSYNKYNTIDIPLSVGYEMGNGRLHTNINAGVFINLYSWQQGLVVDTANKAVSITTGSDPSPYQFKTNIGIGFLGSASFYYKLNDRIHLLAEPYFRYNLSTFNKEEITLKQKFHNSGIRFGIRYDLK